MEMAESVLEDARGRLRRAAGPVLGVERMLDEERSSRDVITQLVAAIRALELVGVRLLAANLTQCIERPSEAERLGCTTEDLEHLFCMLV